MESVDPLYNWPELKPVRRLLRFNQTDAEAILWAELRNRQFLNLKFYRQYGIGRYIVDFYCPRLRLAVELDGGHHGEKEQRLYDEFRTELLQEWGVTVIRFWNYEIYQNLDGVYQYLMDWCGERGILAEDEKK